MTTTRAPSSSHFFGSRNNGENNSTVKSAWRYGKGNVFAPSTEVPEYKNAVNNIDIILREVGATDNCHPGVLLESQYKAGIIVIDDAILKNKGKERLIIKGDGLFTTLTNIPLLNKSGDAHAIIFESEEAVGIVVGSWRGLGQDIFQKMLKHFKDLDIALEKITVSIGPGLGKDAYSIGEPTLEDLQKTFGDALEQAVTKKAGKKSKYLFNVIKLIEKYAEMFKFQVNSSKSHNTFDKTAWKLVKQKAIEEKDPQLPIDYYKSQPFFGARLYTRVDRLARRIANQHQLELPEELEQRSSSFNVEDITKAGTDGRYAETGRCLNGVMKR
jgi:hypothetical protein